jgi:hypothetical protein
VSPDRAEQREAVARALHDTSFSGLEWDQLDGVTRVNYLRQADHAIAAYEEASPQVPVAEVKEFFRSAATRVRERGDLVGSNAGEVLDAALDDFLAWFSPSPSPTTNGRDADVGSP